MEVSEIPPHVAFNKKEMWFFLVQQLNNCFFHLCCWLHPQAYSHMAAAVPGVTETWQPAEQGGRPFPSVAFTWGGGSNQPTCPFLIQSWQAGWDHPQVNQATPEAGAGVGFPVVLGQVEKRDT